MVERQSRTILAFIIGIIGCSAASPAMAANLCGYVAEAPGGPNAGFARGVAVQLVPTGRVVQTGLTDARFCFSGVQSGNYSLVVTPRCNPHGCRPETTPVTVSSQDVSILIPSAISGAALAATEACMSVPALSCPTSLIHNAYDLDVTYIERTPRYRKYGVSVAEGGAISGVDEYTCVDACTPQGHAVNPSAPGGGAFCKVVPSLPKTGPNSEESGSVGNCAGSPDKAAN
jgi:hypothetical protein